MISCRFDDQIHTGTIVLQPNRSWSWRANSWFVCTLMVVSLTVAVTFGFKGIWVILPFTVLEMSVLLACLYYCVRRTHTTEVLTLTDRELIYESGIRAPTQRRTFDRYFARFQVTASRHPWYGKRISLRCRKERLEVGRFLNAEEKDDLVRHLRATIHRLDDGRAVAVSTGARQ